MRPGAAGGRGGEVAGLPEQKDLFQAAEDAREEGRDHGVQGIGQHSACCRPGGGGGAEAGELVAKGGVN